MNCNIILAQQPASVGSGSCEAVELLLPETGAPAKKKEEKKAEGQQRER